MSIKLVVFDMAGTTVKDKNYVGLAFQQAMKVHGYEVNIEVINPMMGYEKPIAIEMILQKEESDQTKITAELIANIHADFVAFMIDFYQTSADVVPLPNVENTFVQLKKLGIKIGLDTGFSRDIADIILSRLKWEDTVDFMVASDEVPNGRPYPDMIKKIMAELNITDPMEVAKVGDTEVDVNEGLNSGCKYTIGITTGAFTHAELLPYHPTHIIDDIAEVLEIISQ
ncbi:phosphonatase-like hydrolase [Pedobacter steynii]|uniref:Phosphonatase-like hydrolase n=1 Tax=Pedobacter steynii TaxID=430522 RepID=A0A1G9SMZ6_9SPHI|nr:HAD-IA family hydrolase [Pedobacter steynii]NQX37369.1 HAD-IA family hydrolase [Pedobacter steynii]SDM36717.1 phosphonatase-like hydrolase [Pedobacter steynii]